MSLSQMAEHILSHLKSFGPISQEEARALYSCVDLQAVMLELKNAGVATRVRLMKKTVTGKPYVTYDLG